MKVFKRIETFMKEKGKKFRNNFIFWGRKSVSFFVDPIDFVQILCHDISLLSSSIPLRTHSGNNDINILYNFLSLSASSSGFTQTLALRRMNREFDHYTLYFHSLGELFLGTMIQNALSAKASDFIHTLDLRMMRRVFYHCDLHLNSLCGSFLGTMI
jgi:hypothetical protein